MYPSSISSRNNLLTKPNDFSQFVVDNTLTITPCTNMKIITTENIPVLLEFLASNRHITKLDLQGNMVSDDEAKALASGFANNKISSIDLSWDGITNKGHAALATGWANNNNFGYSIKLSNHHYQVLYEGVPIWVSSSDNNMTDDEKALAKWANSNISDTNSRDDNISVDIMQNQNAEHVVFIQDASEVPLAGITEPEEQATS